MLQAAPSLMAITVLEELQRRHPERFADGAAQIRVITGRQTEEKIARDNDALRKLQASNKHLTRENAQLSADVARLASIVQTLTDEIARLQAISAGKVVVTCGSTRLGIN